MPARAGDLAFRAACGFLLAACALLGGSAAAAPPPPAYGEHRGEVDGHPYLAWSAPSGDSTLIVAFPAQERVRMASRLRALAEDPAAAIATVCRGAARIEAGIHYNSALSRVLGLPTFAARVLHRPLRRGEFEVEPLGYSDLDGREHMVMGVRWRADGNLEAILTARTGFAPTVASGPEMRLGPPVSGEAEALLAAWGRAREKILHAFPDGGGELPQTHVSACR